MKTKHVVLLELAIAFLIGLPLSIAYLILINSFGGQVLVVLSALIGFAMSGLTAAVTSFVARKAPFRIMIVGSAISGFFALTALSGSLPLALLTATALTAIISSIVERFLWKRFLSFSIQEFDKGVTTGLGWVQQLEKDLTQLKRLSSHHDPSSAHKLVQRVTEFTRYLDWLDEQCHRIEGIRFSRSKRKLKPRDPFKSELERKAWWHASLKRLELLHSQADKLENALHMHFDPSSSENDPDAAATGYLNSSRRLADD